MMRQWIVRLCVVLAVVPASFANAQVSTEAGTLSKIKELGTVYIGHREEAVPFSYLVDGKAQGYSLDICARIVDGIKTKLGKSDLKTVFVPMPANLRFFMLIDGIVDLECGVTSNTRLRQQRISFSPSFFESSTKFLVSKDAKMERIIDMNGKTVAVPAGTTAGRAVATAASRHNIVIKQMGVPDREAALKALTDGKADAFVGDDALLLGQLLSLPNGNKFRLVDEALSVEPYGIGLRIDDPEFKKLVDDVVSGLMTSGEMRKIYHKWFEEPIPPFGKAINLPPSQRLLDLFAKPSDAGV